MQIQNFPPILRKTYLRQTAERNHAKQQNGIPPNSRTKSRQTAEQNLAKQPNKISPNSRKALKFRVISYIITRNGRGNQHGRGL